MDADESCLDKQVEIVDVSNIMINTSAMETDPLLGAVVKDGKDDVKGVKTFDDALESVGVGFFHVLLILVAGWALASDSVEVQCISFVTPQLSDSENPDKALSPDDVSSSYS